MLVVEFSHVWDGNIIVRNAEGREYFNSLFSPDLPVDIGMSTIRTITFCTGTFDDIATITID